MGSKQTLVLKHHWLAEETKSGWVFTHPLAELFSDSEKFPQKIKIPTVLYIEEDTDGVPTRRLKLGQPEAGVDYWCVYSLPASEQGDDTPLIETRQHIAGGHSPYHAVENAMRNLGEYAPSVYFLIRTTDNKIDGKGYVLDVYDLEQRAPLERLAWGKTVDDVIETSFGILDNRRTARELERRSQQAATPQLVHAA